MSPRNQEKLFKPEYAKELIKIAEGDIFSAEAISKSKVARIENAFFMSQQGIEKILKAVLVKFSIAIPLVHDLGVLLAKLPEKVQPPYGYELNELNQFATIRRYEEGQFDLTLEEFNVVHKKSLEMLSWAKSIIKD